MKNFKQLNSQVIISQDDLDLNLFHQKLSINSGETGATVTFTGSVRNSEESGLVGMTLEHYPEMTERELEAIVIDAHQRWNLNQSIIAHRVGYLNVGDPIVFIATCCSHRRQAFEANEFIMDFLKQKATFWKKEHYADNTVWVESKQSDLDASKRWE